MSQPDHPQSDKRKALRMEERRVIYRRYFMENDTMEEIAGDLHCTRLTVSRCLKAQQQALHAIRPELGFGRPLAKIHYGRYIDQVVPLTCEHPRQNKKNDITKVAEEFIDKWWHRQQRESRDKRWMDAGKLYMEYYCVAYPMPEEQVSYKTFTRAMKRIIGEAYATAPGRPKKRLRGRPKGSGVKTPATPCSTEAWCPQHENKYNHENAGSANPTEGLAEPV